MFFVTRSFLQSTLRPRGGENIDFDLLKILHSYFTILRWIDWDIEHHHTTTLKIPYVFSHSPSFTVEFEAPWKRKYWFWHFDQLNLIRKYWFWYFAECQNASFAEMILIQQKVILIQQKVILTQQKVIMIQQRIILNHLIHARMDYLLN